MAPKPTSESETELSIPSMPPPAYSPDLVEKHAGRGEVLRADDIDVAIGTAVEVVDPGAAGQPVVSRIAGKPIVARTAVDPVVPCIAGAVVFVIAGVDLVLPSPARISSSPEPP